MSTTFTPDFLARAAEQLGWDESPAGLEQHSRSTSNQPRSGLPNVFQQTQRSASLRGQGESPEDLQPGQQAHRQQIQWRDLPEREGALIVSWSGFSGQVPSLTAEAGYRP